MPLHITTYNISTMKKTTNQIKTFGLELNLLTYPFLIGECRDYKQKNVAGSHNHPWGVLDWFRGKTHQIFIFWNAVPPTSILRNFFQSPELKLWQLPRVYTRSVHFGTGFRRPPSSPGNFLIKNKNQPIIALLSHYKKNSKLWTSKSALNTILSHNIRNIFLLNKAKKITLDTFFWRWGTLSDYQYIDINLECLTFVQ